jgi:hypothetical protein
MAQAEAEDGRELYPVRAASLVRSMLRPLEACTLAGLAFAIFGLVVVH